MWSDIIQRQAVSIGGSGGVIKGCQGHAPVTPPLSVQFLSFSCSFRGKIGQIIGWYCPHHTHTPLESLLVLENPGFPTAGSKIIYKGELEVKEKAIPKFNNNGVFPKGILNSTNSEVI